MDERAPRLVYIASASQDEKLRKALEKHFVTLVNNHQIRLWHRQQIPLGSNTQHILQAQLADASIILLLLSPDFFVECYDEMELIVSYASSARIIPIMIRTISLQGTPLEPFPRLPRQGLPIDESRNRNSALAEVANEIREIIFPQTSLAKKQNEEQEHKLKAMIADHRGFMHDRLASFVGRQSELAEIQQRIGDTTHTGGYVTITGQAGQGKSSMIAKLVAMSAEESEQVAF